MILGEKNGNGFFTGQCVQKYYVAGISADFGAGGADALQCGGPDLYRAFSGNRWSGADRDRAGISPDFPDHGLYPAARHGRHASFFHGQRRRAAGEGKADYGKHAFHAAALFSGQSTFVALGRSKQVVFFSLLRKAIIVAPLTLLLPCIGLGVNGVFLAEPISNLIGGLASFITMYVQVYRKLE